MLNNVGAIIESYVLPYSLNKYKDKRVKIKTLNHRIDSKDIP